MSDTEALAQVDLGPHSRRYVTRRFRAIEHRFVIELDDATVGCYLEGILSGLRVTEAEPQQGFERYEVVRLNDPSKAVYRLDWGGEHLATSARLELTIRRLLWHINRHAVKESRQHLLIHAAGLEFAGKGIIMPAPEEAGKTTLAVGLVKRGFGYLTDEAVAIHATSQRMLSYPKPFSIDRGSWPLLHDLKPEIPVRLAELHDEQWQVPPERIREDAVVASAPVRYIISPKYVGGATTRLEPLPRAEALRVLAENAFNFSGYSGGLGLLTEIVRSADCYRLITGSLTRACGLIEGLVAGEGN